MSITWLYEPDEIGETPLSRAARSGRIEIARILLMQEAYDKNTEVPFTSPMPAAPYWGLEDAAHRLLGPGMDPDEMDALNERLLHKAVRFGKKDVVEALIAYGADIDPPNSFGLTPLHWAALTGRNELVEILIENGANPLVRDWVSGGMTPLDFARKLGYHEIAESLESCMVYR